MMVSLKRCNTKAKRQKGQHHKMDSMKSLKEQDFIREGFSSDDAFKNLLKDRIFADYFNTFLSLPVFSKRLFYRFDTCTFQVDDASGTKHRHYNEEDVLSFARKERGPLFLKTDICNEYRLCRFMVTTLKESGQNEKYSLNLERELGSVLSMQRLRAYLHESAGESILSFWIAAERYRRQTASECLRFLIREIQDKYIRHGAWLELQETIKVEFNNSLQGLFDDTNTTESSKISDLLLPCQNIAFESLVSYWLPKYLAHRSHRRRIIKEKWQSALHTLDNSAAHLRQYVEAMKPAKILPEKIVEETSSLSSQQQSELQFSDSSNAEDNELKQLAEQVENFPKFSDKSCSGTPDTVITFNDDTRGADSVQPEISRECTSPFRLPRLSTRSSLVSGKDRESCTSLTEDISSHSSTRKALKENGNHFAVLCNRFREISLSRALALSTCIRGNSIVDVEAHFAFPSGFEQNLMPQVDGSLEYLWATLAADQLAGQPFCDYLRLVNDEQAFANLRFWVSAQQLLSSLLQMDTLSRRRQAQALIHIYMLKDSPRKTSLNSEALSKLIELLPNDLGYNALNAACWKCANALLPFWHDFLDLDEERFAECVKYRISSSHLHSVDKERRAKPGTYDLRKEQKEKIPVKHMWNALQLAISISIPRSAKPLLEGYEDPDENDMGEEEDPEGSLCTRKMRILNAQAAKALENYRKGNPYQSSMAYYFYQQNLLLNNMSSKPVNGDRVTTITKEISLKHCDNKSKIPRPKSFQEILHDPLHFDVFKKFLIRHDAEIPLLFWQAVESMRTNTREAKQRQMRANGILRRFFGPSTNYGHSLDCHADIVKELPQMDKVTPAMLVSAQACVARSIEEKWYTQYLTTFPEEEQLEGITKIPNLCFTEESRSQFGRGIKQSSRGFWKIFCRNVISFVRGIADHRVLRHFQNFLRCEHKLNIKKSKEVGEEEPQRVLISNKLVNTEKLLNDLRFWIEVDRYKEFADAVVLCAKLGNYTKDDELIVTRKAKAIVNCFVDSQIPPRIQINIPGDIAESIQSHVKNDIIERGLFHDAAFSVFSVLLYYWKKFCYYRVLPKAKLPECPSTARTSRSMQIQRRKKSLQANRFKTVSVEPDEEYTKIMFSLENGIRLAIVPAEEELSHDNHKLPRINPFRLSKLTRI